MSTSCELIIAEKPSLAKSIAAAIGGSQSSKQGYIEINGGATIVTWCFGHMLESVKPEEIDPKWKDWSFAHLPITPDVLPLKPIPASRAQLTVIKDLCKRADVIINAGDAGREGELLIREVIEYAKATKKPLKRLWLKETTTASIKKALADIQPGSKYDGLYAAAQGRQIGDFWVGMSLTRAWTLAGRGAGGGNELVSVGRVQTPAMSIVVMRDLEIASFKSRNFFEVDAVFNHSAIKFNARWQPSDMVPVDDEGRVLDRAVADKIAAKVKGKRAKVLISEAKPKKESAPLPFHLGGIQAAASAKYGFTAARTLEVMQRLYDERKALSYPRTECRYLAESQIPEAPGVLAAIAKTAPHLAPLVAKANAKLRHEAFNDKKMGEHHALIPTSEASNYAAFTPEEQKLYDLVAKSYIALFYPDHEYKALALEVECEAERFRTTGNQPTVIGWKEIFGKTLGDEDEDGEPEQVLPPLPVGVMLDCQDSKVSGKATKAPPRLTDGTLLAAMESVHRYVSDERIKKVLKENQGLGTAATRAAVIERIVHVGFVKRSGKFLIATDKAKAVFKALPKALTEPGLTALFEQELQKIVDGESTLDKFKEMQRKFVETQVELAKKADGEFVAGGPAGPVHKCPLCKVGNLSRRPRTKVAGFFWGCSEFRVSGCKGAFNDDKGKPDIEGKTKKPWEAAASKKVGYAPAAKPAAGYTPVARPAGASAGAASGGYTPTPRPAGAPVGTNAGGYKPALRTSSLATFEGGYEPKTAKKP